MEFSEKLQELRKSKNMTQEELAESLFVSRAAVSKWESGRGLPNIDSLKAISTLFGVTVDDLLSGEEILLAAQDEKRERAHSLRSSLYGLFDVMHLSFFFLPLFGKRIGSTVQTVSVFALSSWIRAAYLALFSLTALFGCAEILFQNHTNRYWSAYREKTSVGLTLLLVSFAVLNRQPYVAFFVLWLLVAKTVVYIKQR